MDTAKENGLVIVRGHSDDVGMLEGAIHDEFYEKTPIDIDGPLQSECNEGNDCPYFKTISNESAYWVEPLFDEGDYAWTFKTNIPHATFHIMEDGEIFQEALVFDIKDMK